MTDKCETCGGCGVVHWDNDDIDPETQEVPSFPCPDCRGDDREGERVPCAADRWECIGGCTQDGNEVAEECTCTVPADGGEGGGEDAAELRERMKQVAESDWFRRAYHGQSLDDIIPGASDAIKMDELTAENARLTRALADERGKVDRLWACIEATPTPDEKFTDEQSDAFDNAIQARDLDALCAALEVDHE